MKSQLLHQANERRVKQGKLNPDVLLKKKPKTAIEEMEIEMGNSHDSQKQSKTKQSEKLNEAADKIDELVQANNFLNAAKDKAL